MENDIFRTLQFKVLYKKEYQEIYSAVLEIL